MMVMENNVCGSLKSCELNLDPRVKALQLNLCFSYS